MMDIHIDGDFHTGKPCPYHCSPTCHPGQIDPDKWHYGCTHMGQEANRYDSWVPFVDCEGDPTKCEVQADRLWCVKGAWCYWRGTPAILVEQHWSGQAKITVYNPKTKRINRKRVSWNRLEGEGE